MTCEDCKRDFLFFAEEQKYWHEELGFYVDAWCVRCCECRKKKQGPKAALRTYSDLVSQETLTSDQLQQLVTCAVELWSEGILKNEQNLRRLANLAESEIPKAEATVAVRELLNSLGANGKD